MQELIEICIYLYNKGLSYGEIADILSVSYTRQRIQQIVVDGHAMLEQLKIVKYK